MKNACCLQPQRCYAFFTRIVENCKLNTSVNRHSRKKQNLTIHGDVRMHVILATMGTDGDVFPHIGLGTHLKMRGHRVTLAAPEPYRTRAVALGFEFCSIVSKEESDRMLADPDLFHPFRSGLMMARWGSPMIPRQYDLLTTLARDPASILVANPGLLAARLVQEKLRTPMVSLLLQPGLVPSSTAPPEMPGGVTIPSWLPYSLRDLYWLTVDAAGYLLVARPLNAFRAKIGLSKVTRIFRWWLSTDLVIGLFPEWYASTQLDWPPQLRLAGFSRFDGVSEGLPDSVRAFCQDGARPIAFTLGTGMTHAASFFRMAVAVCKTMGTRGILLSKYPHVIPSDLAPSVRHFRFAPFRQLLPLCGALVHHGGVGTTAAALESGCPQLVLPLAWDQPDNAARVTRLGVGLSLGPRQRTRGHIVRALSLLMTAEVRARAQSVASRARAMNGLEIAANWVESMGKGSHG
jgi:rhamnosyltransferase subunit B